MYFASLVLVVQGLKRSALKINNDILFHSTKESYTVSRRRCYDRVVLLLEVLGQCKKGICLMRLPAGFCESCDANFIFDFLHQVFVSRRSNLSFLKSFPDCVCVEEQCNFIDIKIFSSCIMYLKILNFEMICFLTLPLHPKVSNSMTRFIKVLCWFKEFPSVNG